VGRVGVTREQPAAESERAEEPSQLDEAALVGQLLAEDPGGRLVRGRERQRGHAHLQQGGRLLRVGQGQGQGHWGLLLAAGRLHRDIPAHHPRWTRAGGLGHLQRPSVSVPTPAGGPARLPGRLQTPAEHQEFQHLGPQGHGRTRHLPEPGTGHQLARKSLQQNQGQTENGVCFSSDQPGRERCRLIL